MDRPLRILLVWVLFLVGAACGEAEPDGPATPPGEARFTLTIEPPENGEITVDPPDGPYEPGALVTLTALTNDAFVFDGWTGDLSGTAPQRSIFMNEDRTIGARFRPLGEFTITVEPTEHGTIGLSPPGPTFPEGTEVTFTASPDPGHGFTGWTGAISGEDNPRSIVVRQDVRIGATFEAGVIVELATAVNGFTSTFPVVDGGFVPYGTTLQVSAFADPGFEIDSIYRQLWLVEPTLPYFVAERTTGSSFSMTVSADDNRFTLDGSPADKIVVGAHFVSVDTWADLDETHGRIYATPGVRPLRYDVYAPPGAVDLPMVFVVHGGSYVRGTEHAMRGVARSIAQSGRYVVYSVDYRLATDLDPTPPDVADAVADVLGAIAHARDDAGAFGADPDRIAIVGEDVGGHLATLVASVVDQIGDGGYDGTLASEFEPSFVPFTKTLPELRDELTTAIRAVATDYGIFSDPAWDDAVDPFANIEDAAVRALPPQLFRAGAVDLVAPPADIRAYVDALKAAGQPATYAPPVPAAGHGYLEWKPLVTSQIDFDQKARPAIDETLTFLDGVFAP